MREAVEMPELELNHLGVIQGLAVCSGCQRRSFLSAPGHQRETYGCGAYAQKFSDDILRRCQAPGNHVAGFSYLTLTSADTK